MQKTGAAPTAVEAPAFTPISLPSLSVKPALAIAPLRNPSKRAIHLSELLAEHFRLSVGGAFEASGGGPLAPIGQVDSAFAKRGLDGEKSVADSDLLDIAREIKTPFLLSWEPDQNESLGVFLRVRLASSAKDDVVYRQDFPTSSPLATYIVFLNLYAASVGETASAALASAAPERRLLREAPATTPTRHLANGLGELGFGDFLPQRIQNVRARPGDPQSWADLSRAYSRLAASLRSPSAMRKRLAARALAAADLGRIANPDSAPLRQASAFANWLNHLNGRAAEDLAWASKRGVLDGQAEILAAVLRGEKPRSAAPGGQSQDATQPGMEDPDFRSRLLARQFRAWWQDDEAAARLSSTGQDRWDPASQWELNEVSQDNTDQADPCAAALFRASLWLLEAGVLRAWEQGSQVRPVLEDLKRLDPALGDLADAIWRRKAGFPLVAQKLVPAPYQTLQGPDPSVEARFARKPFDSKAFLRGEGELAALARLAANVANAADTAEAGSGALLAWTNADLLGYARALLADAWLAAWESAAIEPGEADLAQAAFIFAESLAPKNAAILTAKASFYDQMVFSPSLRNQALGDARQADPGYAPAARLGAVLREPLLKPEQAGDLYELARALDPFEVRLICWTAAHLARLGEEDRAAAAHNSARDIDPKDPRPFLGLLDIYAKNQLRTIDSRLIAQMLSHYPPTPALRFEAARLYYENEQAERAADLAARLAQDCPDRLEPASLLARIQAYLGREPEMLEALDRCLSRKLPPRDRLELLRLKAELLLRRGKAQEAAAAYSAAAEMSPKSGALLLDLGRALAAAGREDDAVEAWRTASQFGRQAPAALETGRILIKRGELEPALALAREAQSAQPYFPEGYELEALIRISQGEAEGAEAAVKQLIEKAPWNPLALLAQAKIFARLGRHDQAAEAARQGLALHSEAAEGPLLKALIEAMIQTGRLEEARDDLRRLERLCFDDPDALALLARAASAQGKSAEAQTRLSTALRIAPAHPDSLALTGNRNDNTSRHK